MKAGVCGVALPLSMLACSGRADIPSTPDLSALRAGYDHPTAALDDNTVTDALAEVPPLQELASGFSATEYTLDGLDDAGTTAAKGSGSGVRLQGSVHVALRCPGELADAKYDAAINGDISLTLAVADNHIKREIGGRARHCVLPGELLGQRVRVTYDGQLAMDLGADINLKERWSGTLLIQLKGEIQVAGISFSGVSARLTDNGFEHLFALPDGSTLVAGLEASGISLRDSRTVWQCPFDTSLCAHR